MSYAVTSVTRAGLNASDAYNSNFFVHLSTQLHAPSSLSWCPTSGPQIPRCSSTITGIFNGLHASHATRRTIIVQNAWPAQVQQSMNITASSPFEPRCRSGQQNNLSAPQCARALTACHRPDRDTNCNNFSAKGRRAQVPNLNQGF